MELLKTKEAAQLLNISYPTIKQWIYRGKVKTVMTLGGHHRVPRSEVERLLGGAKRPARPRPAGLVSEAISVRNKLHGVITEVRHEGLFSEVRLDVAGQEIMAIITREGCIELGLRKGMRAVALFKATEVMVSRG
jgi:molybdopterin-binding protein